MRKITFLIIVLSSMSLVSQAGATDYYVRPAGGSYGLGNGTSYANAWAGFSNINWAAVDSGNGILYVDGSNTEILTIGQSGEDGTPIHVKGYDGSDSVQKVYMSNKSYVTIEDLISTGSADDGIGIADPSTNNILIKGCTIQNAARDGISIWNVGVNVTIENCTIKDNGSEDAIHNGIFYYGTGSAIFRNNIIYNNGPAYTGGNHHDHGIYIGQGSGNPIDIYGNTLYGHTKGYGIQIKSTADIYRNTIYNNYAGGINIEQNTADLTANVYYNVIYDNGDQAIIVNPNATHTNVVNIYNNSTYSNTSNGSGSWFAEILVNKDLNTLNLKNNIFYSDAEDSAINVQVAQSNATINNNIYYGASGNPVSYLATTRTWSYWQGTLGWDADGINADPLYVNPPSDMHLQSNSPGISLNAGAYASDPPPPPPPTAIPLPPSNLRLL